MVAAKFKKKPSTTPTKPKTKNPKSPAKKEEEDILKAIDAISDESDDNDDEDDADHSIENDSDNDDDGEEWDQEALALRKMISDGTFNDLLKSHDVKKKEKKGGDVKEADVEEDEIDDDDEQDNDDDEQDDEESHNDDDESNNKDDDSDDDDEEEEEEGKRQASNAQETRAKALISAIQSSNRNLPFAESFTVVPPTPLPFGPTAVLSKNPEEGEEEEGPQPVDIHDDLKREVAFYDTALEAVNLAREECEKVGIPFRRPEDFFAEMVKTDEHMAKVKDRLIFETKKIEAVQRRKSNKEQTLMAKERQAHRLAEKAKAKKDHMSAVEEWKKNAERSRGGLGGKVVDVEEEEDRLRGVGKKRAASDRKYGYGGKRGRFKQNDKKTLDDMSGFKPRGGFGGVGQKTVAGGSKKKGGKKRVGKRARDAARSGKK